MAANTYNTPSPGPLGEKNFGADWDSGVTTQPFILVSEAGVINTIWVDATGDLRIKQTTAPTSGTDGTVIGTQA